MEEQNGLMGYEDLGEISINCSNCGAPLVYIQKVKKSDKQTKLNCNCPHCGDKCFETLILGEFYIGSTEFTQHVNIDTEIIDGKFQIEIDASKGTQVYSY